MAGNGTDCCCRMARGISEENETRRWILAVSFEQCSLDPLGLACSSLRPDRFANLPCRNKYPRRAKERSDTEQQLRSLETVQRVEVVSLQRGREIPDGLEPRLGKNSGCSDVVDGTLLAPLRTAVI